MKEAMKYCSTTRIPLTSIRYFMVKFPLNYNKGIMIRKKVFVHYCFHKYMPPLKTHGKKKMKQTLFGTNPEDFMSSTNSSAFL